MYIPIFIALLIFVYGAYVRMQPNTAPKQQEVAIQTPMPTIIASATPSASRVPSVSSQPVAPLMLSTPAPTDRPTTTTQLVYPGAQQTGDTTYQTSTEGKAVFEWYKSQLSAAGFHIGVSVVSSANEAFSAVLQATKGSESMNITIEQLKTNQKTKITFKN